MDQDYNPFAELQDEPAFTPAGARDDLLHAARRGYVPFRKVLVQRPNTSPERAAALADLVSGRHHRALDALLLLHALQPVLPGSPLTLAVWANLFSTRTKCTKSAASKAFSELEDLGLARRDTVGRTFIIEPLREDQSREMWTRPGVTEEEGPGFFTLPHEYWAGGYCDRLTLPGKAMLLILLAETQNPKTPAFRMAAARAPQWYGLSERTAERGYTELSRENVLLVKRVKVADPRHPAGRRDDYWRALAHPFSTPDRARLQKAATTAARQQIETGGAEPSTADVAGVQHSEGAS